MSRRRLRVLAASLAVASLTPAEARAFCRSTTVAIAPDFLPSATKCWDQGFALYWRTACVGYGIQRAGSKQIPFEEASAAVARAFGRWPQASCAGVSEGSSSVSIDVRDLGPVDCTEIGYNLSGPNQNVIVFRDDAWTREGTGSTLAVTTVSFNPNTGEILDADMEINTFEQQITLGDPVPADGYDFASIITHESGHFLGLAHSGDPSATMYAQYNPGSTAMRNITTDDVRGICDVYPPDGRRAATGGEFVDGTACDPTPRRGFERACAEPESGCGKAAVGETSPDRLSPLALSAGAVGLGIAVAAARRRRTLG